MQSITYTTVVIDILSAYLREAHRQQQQGGEVDQPLVSKATDFLLEMDAIEAGQVAATKAG